MNNALHKNIAVIGAGNMGSGIAQKYAAHGYITTLVEKDKSRLSSSRASIEKTLQAGVSRALFSEQEAQDILKRIQFTDQLGDCKEASLVVEAIFEDLSLKQGLFKELEEVCSPDAILATNTSSFKVADLQNHVSKKHRVIGLHYFYPPAKNRLVEIIGTQHTDLNVLARAQEIQESINKVVIKSKDSPGFIVNRFFVPWLNEAMRIVYEKRANIPTVEAASKSFFNIGLGPFELMNLTGLPITLHACNALATSLDDFYAPCPLITEPLEKQQKWDLNGFVDESAFLAIGYRMLAVTSIISCQMVLQEDVCDKSQVDLGAKVGLAWKNGPFELLNEHLHALKPFILDRESTYGKLEVPAKLREHLVSNQKF